MTLEERLAALEERLTALERENQGLRLAAGVKPSEEGPTPRDYESIRKKIERDLTPLQRMKIHDLALDVQRYGYDQAMIMHGRALPRRGRQGKGGTTK